MSRRYGLCAFALWAAAGCSDDSSGGADGAPAIDAQPDARASEFCAEAPDDFTPAAPPTHYNEAFPDFVITYPDENPYSWEKAVLGKILFWEEQISSDDSMACGTCHRPGAGGSDPRAGIGPTFPSAIGEIHGAQGVRPCSIADDGEVSYGGDEVQVTKRKPPSYLDAMFADDLFWDGRATSRFTDPDTGDVAIQSGGALESQAVGPPMSSVEMACTNWSWPKVHAKLATVQPLAHARDIPPDMLYALCANPTYPELFEAAFGDPAITTQRIAFAIATHERTLLSNQTPWDRFRSGDAAALTADQQAGMELFSGKGKCQRCHFPPLFANSGFLNLGFINYDDPDENPETAELHIDLGREEFTGMESDRGKFRTATVRNVGVREVQGVLHDGIREGASLDALIAGYNSPPARDAHTDARMDPDNPGNLLGLSAEEITQLLLFIREGLTDPRVVAEEYPFDRPKLGSEE